MNVSKRLCLKGRVFFCTREIASVSNPATNPPLFGLSFDKFGTPSCL